MASNISGRLPSRVSRARLGMRGLAAVAAVALAAAAMAQPAALPPEVAAHVPANVETYFVAFLVTPAEPRPMSFDLFVRHQAHIRRQYEAGAYRLVGPFTDEDRVRGLVIVSAPSAEQARAIVAADPAVQEGALAVEIHPAMFPSLSSLRIEYPARN